MNAERLHKILIELNDEQKEISLVAKLTELTSHLQNVVNNPAEPTYQEELSKTLKTLLSDLSNATSNSFSPAYKQVTDEIGISEFLGVQLNERLELIFSRNQITPSTALKEIKEILTLVKNFDSAISSIITGFDVLDIGKEELNPGECEAGFSIPRKFIENKLSTFSKEVSEINFILSNLSEIVIGKKEEYEVRTISSSDFLIYISISLIVANALSKILERIINTYKSILEIKNLRNQLKDKGVPAKNTKEVEKYANSLMEKEIKELSLEIVKEYYKGKDIGRRNELSNGLIISLNKIANRIDQGFNIEVRVEPLLEFEEDDKISKEDQLKIELITKIQAASNNLKFITTTGKPILKLNETNTKK